MAINQNDYHYWEGSFKGLLPKEILELSDEDFQTLYEEFIEAKINTNILIWPIENKRNDKKEEDSLEGKVLKQFFKDFLYDINPDYLNYFDTAKEVDLFRSISVNEIKEISFKDKGVCWTYNIDTIYNTIEKIIIPHNKYLTRFYGTTPIDNIDWIESFFLYINYFTNEKELRIYDSQKVFLKGYVNIDFSTMVEYSEDGETSYLLRGVSTKDNFLKKQGFSFKSLLYNPQTDRYDYDGSLTRDILSTFFISRDNEGFTINFGEVTGYFDCSNLGLKSLKGAPIEVDLDFKCSNNQLSSLEGAPKKVGKTFDCSENQLTSLEGAPIEVGENFKCSKNQLSFLKGVPQKIGGSFICSYNQLSSLEGAPQEVGEGFDCSDNKLTSLEGVPKEVKGYFDCSDNKLTSLEGTLEYVGKNFYCSWNKLISLKGAPQEVGGDFWCFHNELTSLKGAPQTVGGGFDCTRNPNLYSLEGIGKVKRKIIKDF